MSYDEWNKLGNKDEYGNHKLIEGEAIYNVVDATEKEFSSGIHYIQLKLEITDSLSHKNFIWDKLIRTEKALWRIKSFCDASGIVYVSKLDPFDCVGAIGRCEIKMKKGLDGKERMEIFKYRKKFVEEKKAEAVVNDPLILDDDIPF